MMVCPVLVVASLVANPTMARPLTAESEQVNWGKGEFGPDQGQWEQGVGDLNKQLELCTQTQIFVGVGSRSYDCDTLSGPICQAQCANQADDLVATCSSQCEDGGALFCAPSELVARWGGWQGIGGFDPWDHHGFDPIGDRDDSDNSDLIEDTVFVDTSTCLQLAVEN